MDDAQQFREQFGELLKASGAKVMDTYEFEDEGERVYSVRLVFPDESFVAGQVLAEMLDNLPPYA